MVDIRNLVETPGGILVPQSMPIPGTVRNSAGGYSYPVDKWVQLDRFLILGTEGGTYYANAKAQTRESVQAVAECLKESGPRTVQRIVEISTGGRAPKNDYALYALAMAASSTDAITRREALAALPNVARIGTHLFHFAHFVDGLRGWGRGLRKAVAAWYQDKNNESLVYQAIKYQQRDGWSHRDLLRLSHPIPVDETRKTIYHWMTHGWDSVGEIEHPHPVLRRIWAMEFLKRHPDPEIVAQFVGGYQLPREALPSESLTSKKVWSALLMAEMPMTALIRNLATMTRVGLFENPTAVDVVCLQILSRDVLKKARVHPIAILTALLTYKSGKSVRGSNTWTPVSEIVDALEKAFYLSFEFAPVTSKRILVAVDVSSSMNSGEVAGVPGLTPRVASAALALMWARTEPNVQVCVFATQFASCQFPDGITLEQVCQDFDGLPFGGTDCALPMNTARAEKAPFDAFVVLTDSETWAGKSHVSSALRQYRQEMGIPAKMVVVGMVSNKFTIADPEDAGMMDVVGFDTATPRLISDFIGDGRIGGMGNDDDS